MTTTTQSATRPLEAGDRLDRAEFHRRYLATPSIKKAELVEGIVYVPSPLRIDDHGYPDAAAGHWLVTYALATPGVHVAHNATVLLDDRNEVQPDVLAHIDPDRGGSARLTPDGFLAGPPELVVEIASSSASYDLHAKRAVYERVGVQEYVVWRTRDEAIDWWALRDGRYAPLRDDVDGVIASEVLPGLVLDVPAMLRRDVAGVIATQLERLGSPEHAALAARVAPGGG